jgi:hypothetical protein
VDLLTETASKMRANASSLILAQKLSSVRSSAMFQCQIACSRMEPRRRERHRWASREAEWSIWEKRHRRRRREGSGERAGTRTSFKRAGANESILSEFRRDPHSSVLPLIAVDALLRMQQIDTCENTRHHGVDCYRRCPTRIQTRRNQTPSDEVLSVSVLE